MNEAGRFLLLNGLSRIEGLIFDYILCVLYVCVFVCEKVIALIAKEELINHVNRVCLLHIITPFTNIFLVYNLLYWL